jgi:lysophospholipase L1-like esterase
MCLSLILLLSLFGQNGAPKGIDLSREIPPWVRRTASPIIHRESSILLQEKENGPIEARLAFRATKILRVAAANDSVVFGSDSYTLSEEKRRLVFSKTASVPVITSKALYPAPGSPNSYKHRVGHPEQNMLYGPGRWFHDRQIEVTYETDEDWKGPKPVFSGNLLPKTLEKLKAKKELRLGISGDSISTGLDASALVKAPPEQKGYPELLAAGIETAFGSKVKMTNRAVSGTSIVYGLQDWPKLIQSKPDLIVVAYGMNDVGRRDSKWFEGRVKEYLNQIHKDLPDTEIILVACMLGNREWIHTPREMFTSYRDQLKSFERPGVAFADLTQVWDTLLANKHDHDLTGNGLNHPNDYGHRLYAWTMLTILGDSGQKSAN